MSARLMKHNPAFLSEADLVRSFVVRQLDLDLLLEVIRESVGGASRHALVIGSRGMGKTTLVRRVVAAVREDPELNRELFPIVFSEESYEAMTAGELWLEALFHLGEATGDERWHRIHHELLGELDERRLQEAALARLLDFADDRQARLLLVVENLNLIFDQQLDDDAAWDIRHSLQNEARILLLGTATGRFEQLEHVAKALFELFKLHELEPLDDDECRDLWESLTGVRLEGRKIRAPAILSGGNPRLLTILSGFAAGRSFRELLDELAGLVDENTTYFKANLETLPARERKVFVTLADLWQPATAREVARRSRVSVNVASAQLKRLVGRGAVREVRRRGRRVWYQVAERLYNIYHLMRRRGGPSDRVRALVDFMLLYYEPTELGDFASRMLREACGLAPEERDAHLTAFRELVKTAEPETRDLLLEAARPYLSDLGPQFESLVQSLAGRIPEGERALDPEAWLAYAEHLESAGVGKYEEALEAFGRAAALGDAVLSFSARLSQGLLLIFQLDRPADAERLLLELVESRPDEAIGWWFLGHARERQGGMDAQAEEAYRRALDLGGEDANVLAALAGLLAGKMERLDEAAALYQRALELAPERGGTWGRLGDALRSLNRFAEAADAYREAAELLPESARAWQGLAECWFLRRDHASLDESAAEEAESAARRAVALASEDAFCLATLGQVLLVRGKAEDAESNYREAIALADSRGTDELPVFVRATWKHNLASLLWGDAERRDEALEWLCESIGTCAGFARSWSVLAELASDHDSARERLGVMIERHLGPSSEVPAGLLNHVAWAIFEHGIEDHYDDAEALARRAVEADPGDGHARHTLGSLLGGLGRWEEALAEAEVFVGDTGWADQREPFIDFFIEAAAAGHGARALALLDGSPCAARVEPLVVALRLDLGEDVLPPQEILEVAEDVLEDIRARRQEAHADS